jgi:hypothetical protein
MEMCQRFVCNRADQILLSTEVFVEASWTIATASRHVPQREVFGSVFEDRGTGRIQNGSFHLCMALLS